MSDSSENWSKLQTSWNGRVHGSGDNACLFSVWVTDLPGQREDGFLVESWWGLPSDQKEKGSFFFLLWFQTSWDGDALSC